MGILVEQDLTPVHLLIRIIDLGITVSFLALRNVLLAAC